MTTGRTIALTIQTFVGTVMSLLLSTLSKFVIAFLPRSKRLLISWLQSPSAVILEPNKRNSVYFYLFPLYLLWSNGALTQWTWVWVNSGSWWWTGRPGVLQSMGSQRVGHDWVTELNWMGPDAMILVFSMFSLKPALSLSSFTLLKKLFSSSSLSAIG